MKITLNDKEFAQAQHQSILDAALAHDNSLIEYQCRDGFCGACRCHLVSGKVGYIKPTLAFIDKNEILPCSAIALSDLVLRVNG